MTRLEFELTPEACERFYDALQCLAKFNEAVTIEAQAAQLAITTLNISKSAYVSMSFDKNAFFTRYDFVANPSQRSNRFSCRLLNKALSSVFRGRLVDPRAKESSLERCEVKVHDKPGQVAHRFQIKMICRHGVTKNYKLTYEPAEGMHALFDRNRATSHWKIQSRLLREYIEYFAPKTEQLDIYREEEKFTFLSFTEKITNGKEILKQPLQTAVALEVKDFLDFDVVEDLHIVINVKDFKNMVVHAETLKTDVTALYSQPSRPAQFSYTSAGMLCEFTFMTIGESSNAPTQNISRATTTERDLRNIRANERQIASNAAKSMPPPSRSAGETQGGSQRPLHLGSRNKDDRGFAGARQDSPGLFITEDDDRRWDPAADQEEEDSLGWDASGDNDVPFASISQARQTGDRSAEGELGFADDGIAPTQRVSQFRGLFD